MSLSNISSKSTNYRENTSLNSYPHTYFDPSTSYIPNSVKELFKWCQYLYMTHSEIAPTINKKCAYVITPIIYETDNKESLKSWKQLLEKQLNIRQAEFKLLLDYEVYGNAYCSFYYPFRRVLICLKCEETHQTHDSSWVYRQSKFFVACKKCKTEQESKAEDRLIISKTRLKLIHWNPRHIDVNYNPITGSSTYLYNIPKSLIRRIEDYKRNKTLVEETPLSVLQAIKEKKNFKLDGNNIYHLKNASISLEDDAYGMPPLLAVFKDAWLFQTYRRAQESIALEHILPMTILSPEMAGGAAPALNIDLSEWGSWFSGAVRKWRRDPNGLFFSPFATRVDQVRGDAQALNVHNDMNQVRQQITGGLDVPQEFIYGGLNWSGSSISLRVLENLFINRKTQLDGFLCDFVIPKVRAYAKLSSINIRHRDFKMADDAQQKQIALSLRQTNTISDQTTIEELGFDYEQEIERRSVEESQRLVSLEKQTIAQAEIEGRRLLISARYEAKSALERMKEDARAKNQATKEGFIVPDVLPGPDGQPVEAAGEEAPAQEMAPDGGPPPVVGASAGEMTKAAPPMNQDLLDAFANNMIKSTSPNDIEKRLDMLAESRPALAKAIRSRLKLIKKQVKDQKPLPEQKPPRRANSPV